MLPILQIGPLAIQLPGLLWIVGLWLGLTLAERSSYRYGIDSNIIYRVVLSALIAAIISARIVYILSFLPTFITNLASIFSLNPDLLDLRGAFAGTTLIVAIFIRRYKLVPWSLLDSLAPIIAVLAISSGLSNLASGDGYGSPTGLPWAIYQWGAWRHPAQVYEIVAAALVLVIFWPGNRITACFTIPGVYGMSVIAGTAAVRLFLEAYRGDSFVTSGGFRSTQLIAWLILALMLWGIIKRNKQSDNTE